MDLEATVCVVDDDDAVRDALSVLLRTEGLAVETFASASDFLAAVPAGRGCVIADVRMPGMSGLELQMELARRGCELPLIFLSGHGDIPMSVRAIQTGAIDFLTKPVSRETLLRSVRAALQEADRRLSARASVDAAATRVADLTDREREVLLLAAQGLNNKQMARELGISHRTVEIHKGRIMEKTAATTVLDLARLVEASGLQH